jgi:translation initiation factor 5
MPKMIVKVEGKGNGMRTVITNMPTVAESLRRPASYPIKYMACELGVMSSVSDDHQCVINGSHKAHKLTNLLYDFIGKFVLCEKCETPETTLVEMNGEIHRKCDLCDHEIVAPKTKATKFFLNNLSAEQVGSKTRDVVKAEKSTTETVGKEKNESLLLTSPVNTNVKYIQDFRLII